MPFQVGGNSGSPVLDAHGRFVAINFDRQRLGLMNEFKWSHDYSRSIGTDVRFILYLVVFGPLLWSAVLFHECCHCWAARSVGATVQTLQPSNRQPSPHHHHRALIPLDLASSLPHGHASRPIHASYLIWQAAGFVLTCTSFVKSDAVLKMHAEDDLF